VKKDGRVATDNNAAERAIRPIAIGRENMFAGSDAGGETIADAMTIIETATFREEEAPMPANFPPETRSVARIRSQPRAVDARIPS
jgi:hypothetical protein